MKKDIYLKNNEGVEEKFALEIVDEHIIDYKKINFRYILSKYNGKVDAKGREVSNLVYADEVVIEVIDDNVYLDLVKKVVSVFEKRRSFAKIKELSLNKFNDWDGVIT